MTIERQDSFAESRREGKGLLKALFGSRTWSELPPGSVLYHGELRVMDKNTVQIYQIVIPGSSRMYPIAEWTTLTGNAINRILNRYGVRWVNGSDERVDSKVHRDSGPVGDGFAGPIDQYPD